MLPIHGENKSPVSCCSRLFKAPVRYRNAAFDCVICIVLAAVIGRWLQMGLSNRDNGRNLHWWEVCSFLAVKAPNQPLEDVSLCVIVDWICNQGLVLIGFHGVSRISRLLLYVITYSRIRERLHTQMLEAVNLPRQPKNHQSSSLCEAMPV